MLRWIRIASWVAVAIAVVVAGALAFSQLQQATQRTAAVPSAAKIGGPFTLTAHTGQSFDSAQLSGKPFLVFFGFTNCPDICPTTLADMSRQLEALGDKGDVLRALFVTVDPERDTADHLAQYLTAFDDRIVGLTGSKAQIDAVVKTYRAYYKKVPTGGEPVGDGVDDGNYTMDHTATVYLMDETGAFSGTLDFKEDPAVRLKKLQRLVSQS